MADDDYAEEFSKLRSELLGEIQKLSKRIDDQDRKFIIVHGRSNAYCRVCSTLHQKHPGDPEISDVERAYHEAGHRFT
jgi:hypothetical protein